MGGIGWDIKLEKTNAGPDVDVFEEHIDEFAKLLEEFIGFYANGPEYDEFWAYWDQMRWDEHFFEIYDTNLAFSFMDMAGACTLSHNLAYYWTRLAFACQTEAFEAIAINHGYQLAEKPTPAEVIAKQSSSMFVKIRDQLWTFYPEYGANLYGDSRSLTEAELTEAEREKLANLAESRTSEDALSMMLTPSARFHDALVGLFSDPSGVSSAFWYAGNVANVSDELMRAALHGGAIQAPERIRWDAREVEKMATRCQPSALQIIRDAMAHDNLGVKALATSAICAFESPATDTTLLKQTAVRNGLTSDAPYCDVAAALIPSLSLDDAGKLELSDAIVDRLTTNRGDSESTEHDLILSVINLWIHDQKAPNSAIQMLRTYSTQTDHSAAGLIQWALNVFGG